MTHSLAVVVTVGPKPEHVRWLPEMLASVRAQSRPPDAIVLVDDAAHLDAAAQWLRGVCLIKTPWHLGQVHGLNIAIASAGTDLVFVADGDDLLYPDCLGECLAEYERVGDRLRYYYVTLALDDSGEMQACAGGTALLHRELWAYLGGYPNVGPGPADVPFVDLVLRYGHGVHPVCQGRPLYWHRAHPGNTAVVQRQQPYLLEASGLLQRYWGETWPRQDRTWVKDFTA